MNAKLQLNKVNVPLDDFTPKKSYGERKATSPTVVALYDDPQWSFDELGGCSVSKHFDLL